VRFDCIGNGIGPLAKGGLNMQILVVPGPKCRTDGRVAANRKVQLTMKRYQTFAGTICEGMEVIAGDGSSLGHVASVEGSNIRLVNSDGPDGGDFSLPLSLIDGISEGKVLLAGRGDASFGLGAQP
jgi:hypothetical protein